MTPLQVLPGGQRPVIRLREKRRQLAQERCRHGRLIVDPELAMVECGECGAQLDPLTILVRLAREETRLEHLVLRWTQLRTGGQVPCQHCGQFTPIPAQECPPCPT